MKKAGIDFGLTHVKAHWIKESGEEMLLSTIEVGRGSLVSVLQHEGITDIIAAGNGPRNGFEGFWHHALPGDPLNAEIEIQAKGADRLLAKDGVVCAPERFIVSIGTGTSYTYGNGSIYSLLIGSAIGAGMADGLLKLLGITAGAAGFDALEVLRAAPSFNLILEEEIPKLRGTTFGPYSASHFAKAAREVHARSEMEMRVLASLARMIVDEVSTRLLTFSTMANFALVRDVIVVGSLPQRSHVIRTALRDELRRIGKNPIFPDQSSYALAVGAYHAFAFKAPSLLAPKKEDVTTETLRMLYPRDLARTLIKAFNDAQPQDDGVLLAGVTPEELEQMFAGDEEKDASPEETAEMEGMKQSLRDNLGKKIVDIPGTPEADAEFLEKEIDTAISVVLSSWFSMLHIALTLANSQTVRLTERLEPVTPILLNKRQPRLTWQEASSNGISLTSEAVDQLYEAFVQRLRPLVDAAPNGLLLPCRPRYAICKDAQGYCLALRP